MTYEEILKTLCDIMTVSGNEGNAHAAIRSLVGEYFDSVTTDVARNLILCKTCGREHAPKILLDAHLDEVGMLVRAIDDDGFVTVVNVGGLDRQILPAADCLLWGTHKTIHGVFAATPPHLYGVLGKDVPAWDKLVIDTGCTKEELEKAGVRIGTPVSYKRQWTRLLNDRVAGQGFDDKCCGAALVYAVMRLPKEALVGDVYITLTAGEEIGSGKADCAAFAIQPDVAIVTDVNFAAAPGVSPDESAPLGEGPMVSLSAVTDRRLTDRILSAADRAGIHVNTVVEPTNTGTNANSLVYTGYGIPTAVVSIPLAGMHSYNEILSLQDAESFARLIQVILTMDDLAEGSAMVTEKGGRA